VLKEFTNEPYVDFTKDDNRKKMEQAIEQVEKELGKEYPLIIGGKKFQAKDKLISYNPSKKDEVVGIFQKADEDLARKALETALATFETWKFEKAEKRASYLFKAAEIMRRRRLELDSWLVFETGKSWVEADGDVAEAIDFLEFYGREAIRYAEKQPLVKYPGEEGDLWYVPLGVGLVIPPWNFPMAILVGMTTGALVAGNTVILKPSSDSPAIGYKFMEVLEEAGLPPGVVNFMSGPGRLAGEFLVKHPKIRFIAFTGSKEVGLRINELAAQHQPGQLWIKRVVAEMGGKDGIVVDDEADIDAAALGVQVSAFGFQGQKCSACSRAIVVKKVYDEFLAKLADRVKAITVGPTKFQKNWMGPVINESAYKSILNYIDIGKKEGRLLTGGSPIGSEGYFIQPTVFADISSKARISQEEIFGPVLAVTKADDFEQALEMANDTEYGLTGAVYSQNRAKLDRAKQIFHVGNLYLNRKCTGALVGVHPFGGFNMSGTDSKAGGRDYLMLFTQAKAIAEKV
jgi:1-pyrroline-5-carboxylate dehydrogenase